MGKTVFNETMDNMKVTRSLLSNRLAMACLGILVCILPYSTAWSASVYTVTDLGVLDGGVRSSATAINNRGQIVGWSFTSTGEVRAVVFDEKNPSNIRELGTLEGGSTQPHDISDKGVIVGTSRRANNGDFRAVVFDADGPGSVRDIGPGSANAVNKNGLIVGNSGGRAIQFDPSGLGNNKDLGTLGGTPLNGGAAGLNERNQIVGSSELANGQRHATLFDGTSPSENKDLGTAGGTSVAVDINDKGQAVGVTIVPKGQENRAVLFDTNNPGSFELFEKVGDADVNIALAINNNGEVIGLSEGSERVPWIYDPEERMIFAINTLLDPTDPSLGLITIIQLNDINDGGAIVGQAFISDGEGGGAVHAVVLTTIPLPGALPLFLTALAGLGLLRWRSSVRSIASAP